MDDKKLFLLDAYALIYRAYYALIRAPRVTSKGFNTSAIFGFCNTLDEILRKEQPSHIAVCFDPRGGTFRHEIYPEYKAQRDAQPEDISRSIPYIKDILAAYHIPVIEIPRYEADDVIGTLSRKAEKEGFITYMMTPDKDYGQLVTEKVLMYRPSLKGNGFEIRGVKEVCERYGISSPAQVIDLLALEGDASDNIPGCPGVGEKTASKLIAEWGSVENLLANAASLKGALKDKITANVEQIKFSKFLVTIKTDVPIDLNLNDLARKEEDIDKLIKIYNELEFKSFISKLTARNVMTLDLPTTPASNNETSIPSLFDVPDNDNGTMLVAYNETDADYKLVDTAMAISEAISNAVKSNMVGIAIYAIGADDITAKWVGIGLSTAEKSAIYIPLPTDPSARMAIKRAIEPLFSAENATLVSHDVKRDYIILKNEGLTLTAKYFDTSVAHYLLQPEMRHELSSLAFTYLGYAMIDSDNGIRKVKQNAEYSTEEARMRLCETADVTLRLYHLFKPLLADGGLEPLMEEIEVPFVKVLAEMEHVGVRIDVGELSELSRQFTLRLHEMEEESHRLAGGAFNVSSPMQVGEVLFERLKIDPKAKRTKKGAYSTTEEILEKYRLAHPVVDLILKIRRLRKLLTTYVNALPELINPITGKIHTSYNQTVTATGRLSSSNPNLQNIPIRSDDGREIRRAFITEPGDLFLSADYSQIELRLMADMSGDKDMIDAFLSGEDIHKSTAAKIYKEPMANVSDAHRRHAKTANFGIIYGISAFGLAERLGIPRVEAKALIDGYFESYPQVRKYMDESIAKAREVGYVSTIKGRKRLLPDINSRNAVVRGYAERNAINAPIQGSAADIIKIAMINIARDFEQEGLKSRMIMQVHDELVFNVKPDELEQVKKIVVHDMENAYVGRVPLAVSVGVGKNWLEAH